MSLSINDQLDSIFNIPKNGSNIKEEEEDSQDASYAEVIVAGENVDFDKKAKQVSDKLEQNVLVGSTVKCPEKDKEDSDDESKRPVTTEKKDQFEEILTQSVRVQPIVSEKLQPVVQEPINFDKDAEPKKEEEDTIQNGDAVVSESSVLYEHKMDENGWYLTPPSPMFKHFYEEKASLIRHITKGHPLDIDKLNSELKISTISTNIELSDIRGMADRLTVIQGFMDRVVHIKIQATGQCAASKRGVELLRGVLAKVSYEKPAARQDGVIYDHMRDFEMYASQLESLEQNAKDVYHNLLEAKEILSRKISISLELLKEQNRTDSLERTFNNMPENVKKTVSQISPVSLESSRLSGEGYDKLEVQEAVKHQTEKKKEPTKKTGTYSFLD